jgi:hypothetical protein
MPVFRTANSSMPAQAVARSPQSSRRKSDTSERFLCGVVVLISLTVAGCTSQTASSSATNLKSGCTENEYLTGPRFPTCNNL